MTALGTQVVLDSGDYPALLAAALGEAARLGYGDEVARGRDGGQLRGLGLAMFLEKSGLGPQETADVSVGGTGAVSVFSGGTSFGQGIETALAQIAADALGVSPDVVRVVNGDTARSRLAWDRGLRARPWWPERGTRRGARGPCPRQDGRPRGCWRSPRTTWMSATASSACWAILTRRSRSREVAHATAPASRYLLTASGRAVCAASVRRHAHDLPLRRARCGRRIDPGTGRVRVLRYLVAYEVGRAVNPALVEGQLRGGAAQGIGGALMEELVYDESGQPVAITFMDYRMPTAAEVPPIDVLVSSRLPRREIRWACEGRARAA